MAAKRKTVKKGGGGGPKKPARKTAKARSTARRKIGRHPGIKPPVRGKK